MRNIFMRKAFNGRSFILELACLAVLIGLTGCQTGSQLTESPAQIQERSEAINLREGDVLRITVPGANLDTTQPIRRDGKIALPLVGEVKAVGMTPAELEQEILKLYAPQLVSKEITLTVQSSSFPVFVTGSVLRPGKILSDHPISALESIMEAGGFDFSKANLKAVQIIRQEGKQTRTYTINLKQALEEKQSEPFYMKPSDIIYVPEKFSWF